MLCTILLFEFSNFTLLEGKRWNRRPSRHTTEILNFNHILGQTAVQRETYTGDSSLTSCLLIEFQVFSGTQWFLRALFLINFNPVGANKPFPNHGTTLFSPLFNQQYSSPHIKLSYCNKYFFFGNHTH